MCRTNEWLQGLPSAFLRCTFRVQEVFSQLEEKIPDFNISRYFSKHQVVKHDFLCWRTPTLNVQGSVTAPSTSQILQFIPDTKESLLSALSPAQGQQVQVRLPAVQRLPQCPELGSSGGERVFLPSTEECRHQKHFKCELPAGTSDI